MANHKNTNTGGGGETQGPANWYTEENEEMWVLQL